MQHLPRSADPLAGLNQPAPARLLASGATSLERLSIRTLDLDISLVDSYGREARIRFSHDQLDYSRTYTRSGAILGEPQGPGDLARHRSGREVLQQEQAWQHEALSYRSTSVEVSGDADLIAAWFSVDRTAQRIFDHVAGLTDGLAGEAFGEAMAQVQKGVTEGFAQAEALLGGLSEIAQRTRAVLERMLERVAADPTERPRLDATAIMEELWPPAAAESSAKVG